MPTLEPTAQRQFAVDVVRRLREAGFTALWAGGCVRDQLLGLKPKDYDVASDARPDQIRNVFGQKRTIPIGASFGVMTVVGPKVAGHIEVATFRTDGQYSDGRHPDSVTFSTPEHDAQRRDFTINGLFFDPVAEQVVDYVGGQDDLQRGVIRAIRNPEERFAEDKLRMLRAVRFAATFGFKIEQATHVAIQHHASEIVSVSAERIAAEMRRIMVLPRRGRALRWLDETNLREFIFPTTHLLEAPDEVPGFPSDALWERGIAIVDALDDSLYFPISLAAFFQPWNEVDAHRRGDFAAAMIGECWKLANDEVGETVFATQHEGELRRADALPWPRIQRILTNVWSRSALAVAEAVAKTTGTSDAGIAFCQERLNWPSERLDPPQLLSGNDLIAAGLPPGPAFKTILDAVRDAQLLDQIHDRGEALALAKQLHETKH
jgi:hypothetical protein